MNSRILNYFENLWKRNVHSTGLCAGAGLIRLEVNRRYKILTRVARELQSREQAVTKQKVSNKPSVRLVVINVCHGGFGLSEQAGAQYRHLAGVTDPSWHCNDIARDDPFLVKIVQELGVDANSRFAKLKVVEIPVDVGWQIAEYGGREWVAEKHRTWQ